ncbi:MAG: NAD(+)/NADH kinase [Desulfovibrionaceae bacterium]|nr:NAD(+)/NADH kinase [Desulfovibrionaceae bacterium]
MQKYNHILLIAKTGHAPALAFSRMLQEWLTARGHSSQLCIAEEFSLYGLDKRPDLAIVLGGDGTMLGVGRLIAGQDIPMIGINFGTVGFLTIADQSNWEEKLTACLNNEIPLQSRMTLSWSLTRHAALLEQGNAINDVVVSHGALARLVSVNISINNEPMGSLRCDGIIFASPMGSSGYTASAGGPILFSRTNAYVFTPICPFMRSVSPMVFPANIVFRLLVEDSSIDAYLTVDGQEGYTLERGDLLTIKGETESLHVLSSDSTFFERIRTRGLVLEQI